MVMGNMDFMDMGKNMDMDMDMEINLLNPQTNRYKC